MPLFLLGLIGLCLGCGCANRLQLPNPAAAITKRIVPSNNRNWKPEFSRLAWAEGDRDQVLIRNIRNNQYVTEKQFVPGYYDRTIGIDQIQSVDYVVVPFNNNAAIAHTMLSFGLDDGSHLSVSAEVRQEVGEEYSATMGLVNQLELMYVVADERDLIRLRTHHRDADVYVYPTVATPQQSQALFVNVMQRVNKLAAKPEFYNTVLNNCTTNIRRHIEELRPNRVAWSWQVLLPGHSDKYAYDLGLLDQRVPFDDLKKIAHVNRFADQHYDAADFSQRIRLGRGRIDRLATRTDASLRSRGGQYLQDQNLIRR